MQALRLVRISTASVATTAMLVGGTQLVVGSLAQARNQAMASAVHLNVRSGPGLEQPVIGSLTPGEQVTAIGPDSKGWTPVRYDGQRAWVYTSYLTSATQLVASGTTRRATSAGKAWTTAALNARTGASLDSPVVTVVPQGSQIELTGRRDGSYVQTLLGGRAVWVHQNWVSKDRAATVAPKVSAKSRARATTALMIRTSSGADFTSLGVIAPGTILDVTGRKANGLSEVVWQGERRWVNSHFLQAVGKTATTKPPAAPAIIGTRYATTTLAIRPSSQGPRYLYEVQPGTPLGVTGVVQNGRAQVVVQGAVRWVSAMYLTGSKRVRTVDSGRVKTVVGGNLNSGGSMGLNDLVPSGKGIVTTVRSNFGIQTMYGVRSDPLPDHPSGHAVDVMLPNYRSNQALGWQVARYLQAHAGELNVKYVIFDQKIWSVARSGEGWRPMADRGGDTANHLDHVHVTVN